LSGTLSNSNLTPQQADAAAAWGMGYTSGQGMNPAQFKLTALKRLFLERGGTPKGTGNHKY
jgi:hypothetical protein